MADPYHRGGGPGEKHYTRVFYDDQNQQLPQQQQPAAVSAAKAAVAAVAAGSMLLLSGLTLTGTVIALVVATPLLVIFSPVLVPAAIAVALLATGFLSSGGFGAAALSLLAWVYRYLAGKSPGGAEQLDEVRARMATKEHEVKEWAQQRLDQVHAP